ncbi:hypothetical protein [Scytonema sp. NUACC26]|uniref:hypothetical protein n=1 Tax=Scytonema sp. NUACC26 TaxID=3140176 RepID=UPI0034DC6CF7
MKVRCQYCLTECRSDYNKAIRTCSYCQNDSTRPSRMLGIRRKLETEKRIPQISVQMKSLNFGQKSTSNILSDILANCPQCGKECLKDGIEENGVCVMCRLSTELQSVAVPKPTPKPVPKTPSSVPLSSQTKSLNFGHKSTSNTFSDILANCPQCGEQCLKNGIEENGVCVMCRLSTELQSVAVPKLTPKPVLSPASSTTTSRASRFTACPQCGKDTLKKFVEENGACPVCNFSNQMQALISKPDTVTCPQCKQEKPKTSMDGDVCLKCSLTNQFKEL